MFLVTSRCSIDEILLPFSFHQSVNLLAMRTRDVVKGNHTRKTASFIRVSEGVDV